jgi:nitrite reductase (NO-forming)
MTRMLKLCLAPATFIIALSACAPTARPGSQASMGNTAEAGKLVWRDKGCGGCHGFGRVLAGPDMAGVMDRRDHDWLRKWLKETNNMLDSDPQAIAMLKDWKGVRMPQVPLSDRQIDALFAFFTAETARVRGAE